MKQILFFVVFLFILLNSIVIVNQTEQIIILQFGKPVKVITEAGLNFKAPFIQNKVVFDLLESKGIAADEITTSVDVTDMDADAYTADRSPYRYRVSSIITVNTQKVDTVLALLKEQTSLIQKGVAVTFSNYSYPSIQFEYTGLNDIKPEMIKDATRNARKAAEQFAIDSESKLGKIKTANQGQFSISDRDQNTPYIKNVRVVTTIQYMLED